MSAKAGSSKKPSSRHNQTPGWRSEIARRTMGLFRKISPPGLVTIVVILGSIAILACFNRADWPLVVLPLVGLSIFLLCELIARRRRHN